MKKALVIDDEPGVRSYISELLVMEGFDVWEAADGSIGLMMIREVGDFDLIVTDILMPNTDGVELLLTLRNSRRSTNTKIIAISGGGPNLNPSSFLDDLRELGADGIIMKPFSLDDLRATLASLGFSVQPLVSTNHHT